MNSDSRIRALDAKAQALDRARESSVVEWRSACGRAESAESRFCRLPQTSVIEKDRLIHTTMTWDFENRLELARRMRYPCGHHADTPPRPGPWFTKPIKNPSGMGVGARRNFYAGGSGPHWVCDPGEGFMWMPAFNGVHFSVDFQQRHRGDWLQRLTVRCEYDPLRGRPARWCRENLVFSVPEPLRRVDAEWLNVELIDGCVIEAHGRRNTDFDNAPPEAKVAHVVWADQRRCADMVPDFDDADGQLAIPRLGFVYR